MEQWMSDGFDNLTIANNYAINFKFGTHEKAKLVAGKNDNNFFSLNKIKHFPMRNVLFFKAVYCLIWQET
jgi:hypothetical protein